MDWNDKEQVREYNRKWHRKNPWASSHEGARTRCTSLNCKDYKYYGARGIQFKLTMDEIKQLWFRDKAHDMKKPSIDRKDNDGNYEFNNCRFIEHAENAVRSQRKPVFQKTKDGKIVKNYPSTKEASRKTGINHGNIASTILGRRKTAGGFIWGKQVV